MTKKRSLKLSRYLRFPSLFLCFLTSLLSFRSIPLRLHIIDNHLVEIFSFFYLFLVFLSSVYVTALRSMEAIMFSRWLAFCFIFVFLLFFCCYFSYAGNQFPLFVRMCIRVNVQFCGLGKMFFVRGCYLFLLPFFVISGAFLLYVWWWTWYDHSFLLRLSIFFVFLIYDEQYTILLTWHSKNNKKRWESSFHRLTWSLNRKNIVRRNLSSMRTHTENPAFHTILCSNCCFEWICAFRWSKTGTSKYFS